MQTSKVTRGLTLVEVMVVSAIVAILGGITFTLMAPAREQTRQKICGTIQKQIYQIANLYAQDNDAGANPEIGDLAYVPFYGEKPLSNLVPYGYSFDQHKYCPSATPKFKKSPVIGYGLSFINDPNEMLGNKTRKQRHQERFEEFGVDSQIVSCATHDALNNLPKTPKKDWFDRKGYLIYINMQGSLKSDWRKMIGSQVIYEFSY